MGQHWNGHYDNNFDNDCIMLYSSRKVQKAQFLFVENKRSLSQGSYHLSVIMGVAILYTPTSYDVKKKNFFRVFSVFVFISTCCRLLVLPRHLPIFVISF